MTTSDVTSFEQTRNEIIEGALRLNRVGIEGEDITAEQMGTGASALNSLVKSWQAIGYSLWTYTESTLFVATGQVKYEISTTTTDNVTDIFFQDDLAVAAVATDTTITMTDASNVTNGDRIGIFNDSNVIFWTTVNGAPAGNVVTLTDAIKDASAISNVVFNYTSVTPKPLAVTQARRFDVGGTETPMTLMEREVYFSLTQKESLGAPVNFYYDPQRNKGFMYLWSNPNDETQHINFTYQRPLEIFDSAADTQDFPNEWIDALTYNLSVRLSIEYGLPIEEKMFLKTEALDKLNEALEFDKEEGSVFVQPAVNIFRGAP